MKDNWKNSYSKAFGNHLKKLRTEKGITQKGLSTNSGISLSHISRMERGKRSPTVNVIFYLSNGLNVQPKSLLNFDFKKIG